MYRILLLFIFTFITYIPLSLTPALVTITFLLITQDFLISLVTLLLEQFTYGFADNTATPQKFKAAFHLMN